MKSVVKELSAKASELIVEIKKVISTIDESGEESSDLEQGYSYLEDALSNIEDCKLDLLAASEALDE